MIVFLVQLHLKLFTIKISIVILCKVHVTIYLLKTEKSIGAKAGFERMTSGIEIALY